MMEVISDSFGNASAHFNAKGTLFIESAKTFKVEAEDIDKVTVIKEAEIKKRFRFLPFVGSLAGELFLQTLLVLGMFFLFALLINIFPLKVFLSLCLICFVWLFIDSFKAKPSPYFIEVTLKSGENFILSCTNKELKKWPPAFIPTDLQHQV